jgi:hypothetical protein
VTGGALLLYNQSGDVDDWTAEHAGPDLPAILPPAHRRIHAPRSIPPSPAWLDPPPFHPDRLEALHRWQRATLGRLRAVATPGRPGTL